jgi:hypothetical protein
VATHRLDADSEDDEEVAARHTLECGMTWARRAFDELILPATSVSFLAKDYLLEPAVISGYASHLVLVGCRPSSLQVWRRARKVRKLHAERTQLEMQLVVARVAATGPMASETSARASLEAARQSAEDRAISVETITAAAATELDSLASRLALTKTEIEKL